MAELLWFCFFTAIFLSSVAPKCESCSQELFQLGRIHRTMNRGGTVRDCEAYFLYLIRNQMNWTGRVNVSACAQTCLCVHVFMSVCVFKGDLIV